ncbi:MAG TPA: lysylphosphatidylglycerol synthase domain-containing protein [Gaiellaceae bacterium]
MQRNLRRLRRAVAISHLDQEVRQSAFFISVGLVLAIGGLAGIALSVGLDPFAGVLRHAHWQWLLVALSATVASYAGYVLAYRETAGAEGLPLRRIGALVAGGFGVFIPRGGFALDLEALANAGVPRARARRRVLCLGTLEYAVLAPATFVVALILLNRHWPERLEVPLSWVIGVPLGGAIALELLRHRESLRSARGWRERLAGGLDGIAETMLLWRRPQYGLLAFLGMALYWAADIAVLWACLAVFSGQQPGVAVIVLGYASGYALTRRALPLAGAGAVEVMLPFALHWMGIPLATAVVSVFAYRIFNLWLPLIPAAAGLFALKRDALASPSA